MSPQDEPKPPPAPPPEYLCGLDLGQAQDYSALVVAERTQVATPQTLIVFSGDVETARAFAAAVGLDSKQTVLLPDPDMQVTRAYQAVPCPRVFVLDALGRVRYTNAHADDAPQKAPALAIVSRAFDALRACVAAPASKTSAVPKLPPSDSAPKQGVPHAQK